MALDPALENAIKQAVEESGQKSAVAQRLIAWAEAISEGNISPEQEDGFYGRLISVAELPGATNAD